MQIKSHRKKSGKIIAIVLLVLIVLVVAAGATAFGWYKSNLAAPCSENCQEVEFAISEGSTTVQIAENLEAKGIIKSAFAFRIYLKLEAKNQNLKAGSYKLLTSHSVAEIVEKLNKGALAETFTVTFLPGATLAANREVLQNLGYADSEITEAFEKSYDHPLLKSKPADASLEGYIYGETYEFYKGASVSDILTRTFDEMYKQVQANDLEAKYKAQGLSLHQGVVLASIVQRESGSLTGDMPKVAQVFLNRLASGTPLGSDAVIAYRADQLNPNRSKTDLSYLDSIGCPWNSRRCAGLPPTAIAAPGLAALKAVANPDKNYVGYYYFLTGDDGKMYYGRTEAEHNQNAINHCQELCQIL